MVWRGEWTPTLSRKNDVTRDGPWLMIANTTTGDRAAPQYAGSAAYDLSDTPSFVDHNLTAQLIATGHRYNFTTGVSVNKVRMWVPTAGRSADHIYRFITIDYRDPANPIYDYSSAFTLNGTTGWVVTQLGAEIIPPGVDFDVLLLASNQAGSVTHPGNWDYQKPNNTRAPVPGEMVHANKASNELRVHTIDDDLADWSTTFADADIGDDWIAPGGQRWTIDAIQDNGTWFLFDVSPADQLPNQGVQAFNLMLHGPQPSDWSRIDDYWPSNPPSNGTRKGLYETDDWQNPALDDHAYGIEIETTPITASPDWDFLAWSPL